MILRHCFSIFRVIFTSDPITPPLQRLEIASNSQWMLFLFKKFFVWSLFKFFKTPFNSLSATTKFAPLSLCICFLWRRLYMYYKWAKIKPSVDKPSAYVRLVARVEIQIKRAPIGFAVLEANLVCFINLIKMWPKQL